MWGWRGVSRAIALVVAALAAAACGLTLGSRQEPPADAPLVLVAPPHGSEERAPPQRDLDLALAGVENALRLRGLRSLPLGTGRALYRQHVDALPFDAEVVPGALVQLGRATGVDAVLFVLVTALHVDDGFFEYDLSWQLVSTIDETTLFEARRRGAWRPETPTVDPTHRAQGELEPVIVGGGDEGPADVYEVIEAVHRGVLAEVPHVPRLR